MIKPAFILAVASLVARADIAVENELISTKDVFDLREVVVSDVSAFTRNTTQYYCVFRSLWTREIHPTLYPDKPSYGNPVTYSHTKQFVPFLQDRQATSGLEMVAEVR